MKLIKQLEENEKINQNFLVNSLTKGVTTKGSTYFNVVLQDSSGTIDGKKWEVEPGDEEIIKPGNIVTVEADVLTYKNGLQLRINKATLPRPEDVEISNFVQSAPESRESLQKDLFAYIDKITNKDAKQVVEEIVKNHYVSMTTYPAAVKNHHEYANGLLYHTVSMLRVADALSKLYTFDMSILYSGVILHDIGKTVELSGVIVPKFTLEGKLIGHPSIIHAEVAATCEKLGIDHQTKVLLEHMVLSHHGKYEFGSPVLPLTKEAEILNLIDNIDARMTTIDKALATVEEGEFTSRQFALEDRSFYKPMTKEEK